MKSSCLSCTGVCRNNLLILRNLTQKYNYVAEFVVCCAPGFCSAVGFTAPIQSFFSVFLKRYQFLWLHLINFRLSKFGTKSCLFAPISFVFVSCQFAVASAKAPVHCGFRERAPSPACKWQLNCLRIGRWQKIMVLKWQAKVMLCFLHYVYEKTFTCAQIYEFVNCVWTAVASNQRELHYKSAR